MRGALRLRTILEIFENKDLLIFELAISRLRLMGVYLKLKIIKSVSMPECRCAAWHSSLFLCVGAKLIPEI